MVTSPMTPAEAARWVLNGEEGWTLLAEDPAYDTRYGAAIRVLADHALATDTERVSRPADEHRSQPWELRRIGGDAERVTSIATPTDVDSLLTAALTLAMSEVSDDYPFWRGRAVSRGVHHVRAQLERCGLIPEHATLASGTELRDQSPALLHMTRRTDESRQLADEAAERYESGQGPSGGAS